MTLKGSHRGPVERVVGRDDISFDPFRVGFAYRLGSGGVAPGYFTNPLRGLSIFEFRFSNFRFPVSIFQFLVSDF
jgi:hypothetical protein